VRVNVRHGEDFAVTCEDPTLRDCILEWLRMEVSQ